MVELPLEERLTAFGDMIELEGADRLADDVVAALDLDLDRYRRPPDRARPLAGAGWRWAAAVAAAVIGIGMLLPGPRRTVAHWFGFDSVRIERRLDLLPGGSIPSTAPPLDVESLQLGPAVRADEAAAATGLPVPLVGVLGDPISIHTPTDEQIAVVYAVDGERVLVATLPGRLRRGLFTKFVGPESELQTTSVDGTVAYWISGAPHWLLYEGAGDDVRQEPLRLATNTLLWQRGGVVYRIEAAIDLDTALSLAGSI